MYFDHDTVIYHDVQGLHKSIEWTSNQSQNVVFYDTKLEPAQGRSHSNNDLQM
jgi:hypothetical protein